jgi:hypothetical protein
MRNYNDTIGNRTRDLLACRVVPQPYATTYPDFFKTNRVESTLLPGLLALPYETERNKITRCFVFLCQSAVDASYVRAAAASPLCEESQLEDGCVRRHRRLGV